MKCPICKIDDYCQYIFNGHFQNGLKQKENPGNSDIIYICPALHVYDMRGNIIVSVIKNKE